MGYGDGGEECARECGGLWRWRRMTPRWRGCHKRGSLGLHAASCTGDTPVAHNARWPGTQEQLMDMGGLGSSK